MLSEKAWKSEAVLRLCLTLFICQFRGALGASVPPASNLPAGKPFSIQQRKGGAWLVKPDGERFFSFGVCVVDEGASREEFDPKNPGYAAWQHYPDSNRWAGATLKRLRSWGFTTIGGWSDFAAEGVGSFEELDQRGMLHLRPGSNGIRTYRRFLGLMADRYYSLGRPTGPLQTPTREGRLTPCPPTKDLLPAGAIMCSWWC